MLLLPLFFSVLLAVGIVPTFNPTTKQFNPVVTGGSAHATANLKLHWVIGAPASDNLGVAACTLKVATADADCTAPIDLAALDTYLKTQTIADGNVVSLYVAGAQKDDQASNALVPDYTITGVIGTIVLPTATARDPLDKLVFSATLTGDKALGTADGTDFVDDKASVTGSALTIDHTLYRAAKNCFYTYTATPGTSLEKIVYVEAVATPAPTAVVTAWAADLSSYTLTVAQAFGFPLTTNENKLNKISLNGGSAQSPLTFDTADLTQFKSTIVIQKGDIDPSNALQLCKDTTCGTSPAVAPKFPKAAFTTVGVTLSDLPISTGDVKFTYDNSIVAVALSSSDTGTITPAKLKTALAATAANDFIQVKLPTPAYANLPITVAKKLPAITPTYVKTAGAAKTIDVTIAPAMAAGTLYKFDSGSLTNVGALTSGLCGTPIATTDLVASTEYWALDTNPAAGITPIAMGTVTLSKSEYQLSYFEDQANSYIKVVATIGTTFAEPKGVKITAPALEKALTLQSGNTFTYNSAAIGAQTGTLSVAVCTVAYSNCGNPIDVPTVAAITTAFSVSAGKYTVTRNMPASGAAIVYTLHVDAGTGTTGCTIAKDATSCTFGIDELITAIGSATTGVVAVKSADGAETATLVASLALFLEMPTIAKAADGATYTLTYATDLTTGKGLYNIKADKTLDDLSITSTSTKVISFPVAKFPAAKTKWVLASTAGVERKPFEIGPDATDSATSVFVSLFALVFALLLL